MYARLESPEMRAIQRNGSTMTLASSRAQQASFEADGIAREAQLKVDYEGTAQGDNQTTQTVTRAGIGTAIGAIIGAVAGGGKGAAIDAVIGRRRNRLSLCYRKGPSRPAGRHGTNCPGECAEQINHKDRRSLRWTRHVQSGEGCAVKETVESSSFRIHFIFCTGPMCSSTK